MISFSVLDDFVNLISNKVHINYDRLNEYKNFIRDNEIPTYINFKTARHHILPKSEAKRMGINKNIYNSNQNMVILSYKNHAIAHILLSLAVPTTRICWIVKSMFKLNDLSFSEIISGNIDVLSDQYSDIMERASHFISETLTGRVVSDETREKNRQGRLGKKDSAESRKKKSLARLGMAMPESTRSKHRRENLSDESRKKLSAGHKPMPEDEKEIRRQRMSKLMKDKPKSDEHRAKIAVANLGSSFYNNGIEEVYIHGEPPFGFQKGRLSAYRKKIQGEGNPNAGNFIWTNGLVEVRSKDCPGKEFMRGKLRDYYPPHISLFD